MNQTHARSLAATVALFAVTLGHAAKPGSDIQPPDSRRVAVEKAEKLAAPAAPEALPAELANPFSPPGFEGAGAGDGTAAAGVSADGKPAAPAVPQTDQAVLAAVAAKIPTTGTIQLGGKPLLISGKNRIEVGSHFTVVYNGQEYELELVAIERTTFTVRYKGEEYTRPITKAKSP